MNDKLTADHVDAGSQETTFPNKPLTKKAIAEGRRLLADFMRPEVLIRSGYRHEQHLLWVWFIDHAATLLDAAEEAERLGEKLGQSWGAEA